MIKVNKKMLNRFIEIMDEFDEPLFGDEKYLKKQLEICLNTQGYWSGCTIRVYYNKDTGFFRTEPKYYGY